MQRKNIQTILLDTITGFMPAAFLTMTPIIVLERRNSIQPIHWGLLFMELILMASGFALLALLIASKGSLPERRRTIISGVAAVFLLGLLSAFLQGAHLGTIIISSILAGGLSALVASGPRVKGDREVSDRGLKNLSLHLTLLACTITAILFTLALYVVVVRSHGGEVNLLARLGHSIVVSVVPAVGVLFLVGSGWLSSSWKRTASVYALSFTLIFVLQLFAAIVRGR